MSWQRQAVGFASRAAARELGSRLRGEPTVLADEYRVDPDWRRIEDGYAARLDARTTIDVARPIGRWQDVNPLVAHEGWRSPWKVVGLGIWAVAVGGSWWVGRRGRGPLAAVERRDESWADLWH